MSDKSPLKVVLCWHMHQPHYFDRENGEYRLPWTYLHATKDYVDMAAILEEIPGARAVVNFAPTLLEQIDDYAEQVRAYLDTESPIRDPLLASLVSPAFPSSAEERVELIRSCLRANEKRLIQRFEPFQELAQLARHMLAEPHLTTYLEEQFFADLVTWYHLAWMGETVRRGDDRVRKLMDHGREFSLHQRRQLLEGIAELLSGVLDRYRRLAESKKVELSVTPYAHPIIPLLLEIDAARETQPDAPMPEMSAYPGGEERVRWHIEEGLRVFERHFGFRPVGCWPSEGGISDATVRALDAAGFSWVATGESVLRNSLGNGGMEVDCIHRPFRLEGTEGHCFFRDDGLSDLIGFTYADWRADDAVGDLIHHLENIGKACAHEPNRIVPIILDGENAWEHYANNGYSFLATLYRRLAEHPDLELTTFAEVIEGGIESKPLPHLVAGSWVYGTFSTWIGDPDKNRGWDLLGHAKRAFDTAVAKGKLKGQRLVKAEHQLAICEGSDWFWWFGDYNPSDSVRDFERLYRLQLCELYRLIGAEPPEELVHIISHGGGTPATGGVMRRGKEAH